MAPSRLPTRTDAATAAANGIWYVTEESTSRTDCEARARVPSAAVTSPTISQAHHSEARLIRPAKPRETQVRSAAGSHTSREKPPQVSRHATAHCTAQSAAMSHMDRALAIGAPRKPMRYRSGPHTRKKLAMALRGDTMMSTTVGACIMPWAWRKRRQSSKMATPGKPNESTMRNCRALYAISGSWPSRMRPRSALSHRTKMSGSTANTMRPTRCVQRPMRWGWRVYEAGSRVSSAETSPLMTLKPVTLAVMPARDAEASSTVPRCPRLRTETTERLSSSRCVAQIGTVNLASVHISGHTCGDASTGTDGAGRTAP